MSQTPKDTINRIVMLKTAQGSDHGLMHVHGYHDHPVYTGVLRNGATYCWRADLIRMATLQEEAEYWQARAAAAEAKLFELGQGRP